MTQDIAICFVKTPGLSPLKTRLSAKIGKEKAEEFYHKSVAAISETLALLEKKHDFKVYWAVAEKEALSHKMWSNFECLWQGEGGLGDRLASIEEQLPDAVNIYYIGADAPQITHSDFVEARDCLAGSDFFLCPSEDGGYWLYAGRKKIGSNVWLSVPYSKDDTFKVFKEKLEELGSFVSGKTLRDVDYFEDLVGLKSTLSNVSEKNKSQSKLCDWLSLEFKL